MGQRRESALDAAEVVVWFVELVGEVKKKLKLVPRFPELDGMLAVEVKRWEKEQVWTA